MRDFDREFDRMRRSGERRVRLAFGLIILIWLGIATIVFWGVTHPREIGAFFGHVMAGAREGAADGVAAQ